MAALTSPDSPGAVADNGSSSDMKNIIHPQYQNLQSRLDSFVGWPGRFVPKTPKELSAAGFFYIGSADRVTCFQCGITLRDWEEEHDPVREHRRYSEDCAFINTPDLHQLGVASIPATLAGYHRTNPESGRGEKQDNVTKQGRSSENCDDSKNNHCIKNQRRQWKHTKFESEEARLESFSTMQGQPNATEMAAAGFFYTGEADQVTGELCLKPAALSIENGQMNEPYRVNGEDDEDFDSVDTDDLFGDIQSINSGPKVAQSGNPNDVTIEKPKDEMPEDPKSVLQDNSREELLRAQAEMTSKSVESTLEASGNLMSDVKKYLKNFGACLGLQEE